ncbi:hypothetical protein [Metabacillus litoralis]|uniref:hypothetical protein n=1 Tax=Metabacillus litoralis TaxID=152268 RepID=UPI001CFC709D|nr:hypothetical protein [Metabacillus litoralis]
MKIKHVSMLFLLIFVMVGCQTNSLNLDEDVTKVEVYNWQNEELIKTFEDTSFIESLINNLNNANVEKMSDTFDIEVPPYQITFKNKEEIVMELGLYQTEIKAHFMDIDKEIMYIVDTPIPIE